MDYDKMDREIFIKELEALAKKHGENVSDHEAWLEDFKTGDSAEQHFYTEFPEHLNEVTDD